MQNKKPDSAAPEELEDGEDDIVDVAEPARLALLGVVQPAGPIDGNVGRAGDEFPRRHEGRARVALAVRVHVAKDRAVVADVEPRQDRRKVADIVGRDSGGWRIVQFPLHHRRNAAADPPREEIDIVLIVKHLEFVFGRRPRLVHVHLAVQPVPDHEVVCQGQPVRLHRVPFLCGLGWSRQLSHVLLNARWEGRRTPKWYSPTPFAK